MSNDEQVPHHHHLTPQYSVRLTNSLLSTKDDLHEYVHNDTHAPAQPTNCRSRFCKFYSDNQLFLVVLCAVLGIALGVGLSYWNPENQDAKKTALLWIGLFGELFLRALRCVILPLVFTSIVISVMDMLALGKAGKLVGHTIGLYLLTTVCAVVIGIVVSLVFSSKYTTHEEGVTEHIPPEVRLACSVDAVGSPTSFLTEMNDGSLMCMAGNATEESSFLMQDVNGYFATTAAAKGLAEMSISESLYQGLFMALVGSNMIGLFVENNFLGTIVLAVSKTFIRFI